MSDAAAPATPNARCFGCGRLFRADWSAPADAQPCPHCGHVIESAPLAAGAPVPTASAGGQRLRPPAR